MPRFTFSITSSGDDDHVYKQGNTYSPSAVTGFNEPLGTDMSGTKGFIAGGFGGLDYGTYVGMLRFDTSIIPDELTVMNATLRLYISGLGDPDSRNFNIEWYTWTPPSQAADFAEPVGTTAAAVAVSTITGGVLNDFVLSNAGANVSKTAYTGVRMGISGGVPTGYNHVDYATFDNVSNPEPVLLVDTEIRHNFFRLLKKGLP